MKVWVVIEQDCEDLQVVGVFDSALAAGTFVAENPHVQFVKGRWAEEWDVQTSRKRLLL